MHRSPSLSSLTGSEAEVYHSLVLSISDDESDLEFQPVLTSPTGPPGGLQSSTDISLDNGPHAGSENGRPDADLSFSPSSSNDSTNHQPALTPGYSLAGSPSFVLTESDLRPQHEESRSEPSSLGLSLTTTISNTTLRPSGITANELQGYPPEDAPSSHLTHLQELQMFPADLNDSLNNTTSPSVPDDAWLTQLEQFGPAHGSSSSAPCGEQHDPSTPAYPHWSRSSPQDRSVNFWPSPCGSQYSLDSLNSDELSETVDRSELRDALRYCPTLRNPDDDDDGDSTGFEHPPESNDEDTEMLDDTVNSAEEYLSSDGDETASNSGSDATMLAHLEHPNSFTTLVSDSPEYSDLDFLFDFGDDDASPYF